ncbi:amidohydrolase [Streptomyces spinosirectus]|jgi:predicted TIM-barrel fold metal-dependent hydrolase|uniref:amidohydrolase family protein n=1 Tax=Streptomyces TaxID=1883 RepID=UPI000D3959D3|nr:MULTISPECIES: amidohydrolase family protein [Streptomyces]MBY8344143.1 amidohydrolase [Streptomyces plumbidurans]PTM86598.1 putative TIM-barrel fold metal-dependent hydrolase [Streptomyces sp. VMFN-G11Ma]UIR22638.1 amidohydrolase [Streptomyces spinosirectus]
MDIIDTHCHVIAEDEDRYPRSPIGGKASAWATSRPVTTEDMLARMDEAGIRQSVLVQATTAYGYDNSYVRDSRAAHPDRLIAVGTFDPLAPEAPARLASAVQAQGLAGVRLFTSGSTVPVQGEWFAAPEAYPFWQAAAELDVTVCLQMRLGPATRQLVDLLQRFPTVRVFLDHIGYPDIAAGPARAGKEVAELADHPGLHLKLTHRNLEPLHAVGEEAIEFLTPLIDSFGAERIAWGSNLPAADQSMTELVDLARTVLAPLPEAAQEAIFAGTARRLYASLGRRGS